MAAVAPGTEITTGTLSIVLLTIAFVVLLYRLKNSLFVSQLSPPDILQQNRPDPLVTNDEIPDNAFADISQELEAPFDFFEKALPHIGARPLKSDVVELRHCHLTHVDYLSYIAWASPVLMDA